MPALDRSPLYRYRYDPLDRLANLAPAGVCELHRFYCQDRLATEIQGAIQQSIVQQEDRLLAQKQRQAEVLSTTLLTTDQQRSVLYTLTVGGRGHSIAYCAYGHRPAGSGLLSPLGFNGERQDRLTSHYLLGNGYRAFNPVLMRFNGPDSLSPFGAGGINTYTYCMGDPINHKDPSGHTPAWLKSILRSLRLMRPHADISNVLPTPVRIGLGSPPTTPARATPSTPPPQYSPPRTHRTSPPTTTTSHGTPSNARLERAIAQQEASASIQRSRLDDIANGLRPELNEIYAELHQTWRDTLEHITSLKSQIRPPAYDSVTLPDYRNAIRQGSS